MAKYLKVQLLEQIGEVLYDSFASFVGQERYLPLSNFASEKLKNGELVDVEVGDKLIAVFKKLNRKFQVVCELKSKDFFHRNGTKIPSDSPAVIKRQGVKRTVRPASSLIEAENEKAKSKFDQEEVVDTKVSLDVIPEAANAAATVVATSLKVELKRSLTDYYEEIKVEIETQAKDHADKDKNATKNEMIQMINENMESNMNDLEKHFETHSAQTQDIDQVKRSALTSYCVYLKHANLSELFKRNDNYRLGILIAFDFYVNQNLLNFIKIEFCDENVGHNLKFDLNEEILLIQCSDLNLARIKRIDAIDESDKENDDNEDKNKSADEYIYQGYEYDDVGEKYAKSKLIKCVNMISVKRGELVEKLKNVKNLMLQDKPIRYKKMNQDYNELALRINMIKANTLENGLFASMKCLENLKILQFSTDFSKINFTKELFSSLNNQLENLFLRHSPRTNFEWPAEFTFADLNLTNLTELAVENFKIAKFSDKFFGKSEKLCSLTIHECVLRDSSFKLTAELFKGLTNLEIIQLIDTGIESIDNSAFSLVKKLRVLNLSGIEFFDMDILKEKELENLEDLYLTRMDFKSLDGSHFDKLINLKVLRIGSVLDRNHTLTKFKLPKLEVLELEGCNIDSFETSTVFDNLVNLKSLDLSYNELYTIPLNLFKKLTKLEMLDLSLNKIMDYQSGHFKTLQNLKFLNLEGKYHLEPAVRSRIIKSLPANCQFIDRDS